MKSMQKDYYGNSLKKHIIVLISLYTILFVVFLLCSSIIMYSLDTMLLEEDISFFNSIEQNFQIILIISFGGSCYMSYLINNWFRLIKPNRTDVLASQHFLENEDMLNHKYFSNVAIDTNQEIKCAGMPINFYKNRLIYDTEKFHSLIIGTTSSGKTRKILMNSIILSSLAGDSIVVNDPKKELYFSTKKYLEEEKGYRVLCIDLRNLEYSDFYNPLDEVINAIEVGDRDNADEYAGDLAFTLAIDPTGKTEPIWMDGQRALIKSCILAVCSANVPRCKKNLYSVYMMLSNLCQEINSTSGGKIRPLSKYFDDLPETDISKIAYAGVSIAGDKTAQSFYSSTLQTLNLFSSAKLSKVISKSNFNITDFIDTKVALFIVTPHEKETYNKISSLIVDQIYRRLSIESLKYEGMSLPRRVQFYLDECGNMPELSKLKSKITVARGMNILFHLLFQDFAQIKDIYNEDGAKIIKSNCNRLYFISSNDYTTCEEISKSIGSFTEQVENSSHSFDKYGNKTSTSISFNQQQRALIDTNELMSYDNTDGNRIIVIRTNVPPMKVNLPDITQYSWSKHIKLNNVEEPKEDFEVDYAIPRPVNINCYWDKDTNRLSNGIAPEMMRYAKPNSLNVTNLYWYFSQSTTLGNDVLNFATDYIAKNKTEDPNIALKSPEFLEWLKTKDVTKKKEVIETEVQEECEDEEDAKILPEPFTLDTLNAIKEILWQNQV